ncbi:MAG: AAA-like domain-containing protein, partial [Microcoleaceae cyanobacterium]
MDKSQRDRGRILTLSGLKKLNEAIALWKDENNLRGTLVEIEAESGVGSDTISKIRQGRVGADISKIQQLFTAFNLKLEEADHRSSKEPAPLAIQTPQIPTGEAEPGIPDGQVTIESTFYIERPPIEERCFQTILQPSALIRIKAPRRFGKTSLMARILE